MMTPNDINVLLWCHCRPIKHERFEAPAVREAHEWMEEKGLIELAGEYHITTHMGKKLVEMLCDTPLPVWADPRLMNND